MRFWRTWKSRLHMLIRTPMAMTSRGMVTSMTTASSALMLMATARAATNITGARTSIRRAMVTIIWMALTSLVMRVMREAEENRSMSAKEKSCTLL